MQGCNTAEISVLVFPKNLKQLTTNSAFSPFHQEVSTLLGKQRPKLEVCNKLQGQKCSFRVKPKLVIHQGHFSPPPALYLKTLIPHLLELLPYSRDSTVHIQTVAETTNMSHHLCQVRQSPVVCPGAGEGW